MSIENPKRPPIEELDDLREALKRTIKAIRAHSLSCVHTHNDICDEFDAMLTAHPPDESEKRLEGAESRVTLLETALIRLKGQAWLDSYYGGPKPTSEPDTPKPGECEHHRIDCALHSAVEESTPAPSSHARELRVPEPFASVMEFGGRTALGLNADEIGALWRAITNEIELRIEARAAARKPS